MRRLIDLLRQIAEGPEVPGGRQRGGCRRPGAGPGIVLESALI
jgi:hypothetical protein